MGIVRPPGRDPALASAILGGENVCFLLHVYGNFSRISIARCFLAASSCRLIGVSLYLSSLRSIVMLPSIKSFGVWLFTRLVRPHDFIDSRNLFLCVWNSAHSFSTCSALSSLVPQYLHSVVMTAGRRCLRFRSDRSCDAFARSFIIC